MKRLTRLSWFACLLSAILIAATSVAGAADQAVLHDALESITSSELSHHVDALADDTFEGREAGSRGGRAAGVYIGRELQRMGLAGAGDANGYYQSFGSAYRNILAQIEGSDPQLKDEIILLGAHYDHVGYGTASNSNGPTGYIHNGADDNASGIAALLEVAEALAQLDPAPRRTIVFAWWDGEEKGLLGSKHWIAQPTLPLDRVALMVNMDMVGRVRNDRLTVYGTRTGRGLRRLVSRRNRESDLWLDFTWEISDNSDHYPFFEHNIAILMLHSGLHDDYHRPSDDAEKVNAPGMQRVARLMLGFAHDLANGEALPTATIEAIRKELLGLRSDSISTRRRCERLLEAIGHPVESDVRERASQRRLTRSHS